MNALTPDQPFPDIPLLRKCVAWAEAEAAKTDGTCMWEQGDWVTEWSCGTAYCIAGYAAFVTNGPLQVVGDEVWIDGEPRDFEVYAADLLGLTGAEACDLFDGNNDITDVRDVAEQIAARAGDVL